MRKITFLIFIAFITNSCSFEDYDTRTYYDTVGVGYVYYRDTKQPASIVRVTIDNYFENHGYATNQSIFDYFYTDENGYFCIKFLKRTHKENVLGRSVWAWDDINILGTQIINISNQDIINSKTINIDTLWLQY